MSPSSPDLIHQRIRRKPPPTLDISERYPSPDPLDPFAPLWVLRNRTSSGLSSQDLLESNIVTRTRSTSCLYSTTTTAQLSLNTAISPLRTPSPKKIGHYRPYSQSTLIDSQKVFPLISSPLASQSDLLYRQQPFVARPPFDNYDSSGTESDTASVPFPPHKSAVSQPSYPATSNYRFPKLLLLKKASFLGSGRPATGNRSSMIEFKQIQKSNISPPVVSTVTWVPNLVTTKSINGQSPSKFTTSVSADLPEYHSLTLTSAENIHHLHHYQQHQHQHQQHQQHHKKHPVTSDSRGDLKQDEPRLRKLPSIPVSPKMLRKRISSSIPFSSNIRDAPSTRSISSSYVHISAPTLVLSCSQPASEDAYTSPRKAPVPPPTSATVQARTPKERTDKSHSTSPEWEIPSLLQLNYAASLPITGDDGKHIKFGSLFESQRTIVIFIRHFWCPLCQDYMSSVKSLVRPDMVCNSCESGNHHHRNQNQNHGTTEGCTDNDTSTRVRFVVISNGAHGMIAKYRQIFGLPFKVYTDPTLALYQALGMDRDGDVKNHKHQTHRYSTSEGGSMLSEKNPDFDKNGGYVRHSLMGGIAMVMMRAFKVCMPVWEKGGDVNQLGGEFIFGPGLTCSYAHRMQTTKGHAPIQDVFQAAGISVSRAPSSTTSVTGWPTSLISEKGLRRRRESMKAFKDNESSQLTFIKRVSRRYSIGMMSREEEDQWMRDRQNSIERLQEKRNVRRGIGRVVSSQSQSQSSRQDHLPLETTDEMGDDLGRSDDHAEERNPITCAGTEDVEGERPLTVDGVS